MCVGIFRIFFGDNFLSTEAVEKNETKRKKKKRKMLIAFKYVILLSPNFPSIFRCPLCACVCVCGEDEE